MSACPAGLPLAQKMSDVAPTSEAMSVSQFSRSKAQKETAMSRTDAPQRSSSPFVKVRKNCLTACILTSKKGIRGTSSKT